MPFANRTAHLKPEGAYQVLARANQLEAAGKEIIHLEIGQPDYATFENVSQAGIEAIRAGKTRYTPPAGMPSLREAIAEDAGRRRGIAVHPDEVVVSPGGKPNLFFPTLALVEPGDEVIYPNPGFPTYEAMIKVAGGVIPPADLEHIAAQTERYGCWVMSDELYTRIVYDDMAALSTASLPGLKERTIIVDGFSKTYSMTGWRLGFGIMPKELAAQVDLLLTHSIGSTAHFTQFAGLEALTGPQEMVNVMVSEYRCRRDAIVDGLNAIPGFLCQKPQGAFYVFPNITGTGMGSTELANLILEKAGVALLPGNSFGQYGEGYLRLSYANSIENIEKGLERIHAVLA